MNVFPIATATGAAGFASAWGSAVTADGMWDGITPLVPVMAGIFIFAFVYRVFRRTTQAGSRAKFKA